MWTNLTPSLHGEVSFVEMLKVLHRTAHLEERLQMASCDADAARQQSQQCLGACGQSKRSLPCTVIYVCVTPSSVISD